MKKKKVVLLGNPNVGKSTVFNEITASHQHTGNWTGKTVELARGEYSYKYIDYELIDLPGAYSLIASSREERLTREYILGGCFDCVVMVIDSTMLLRNLNLFYQLFEITSKVVILLNLSDEAEKRNIFVDAQALKNMLGVPVVKATARSGRGINALLEEIHLIVTNEEDYYTKKSVDTNKFNAKNMLEKAQFVESKAVTALPSKAQRRDETIDKILLGKYTCIPVMLLLLALILWITVKLSNYPSEFLAGIFGKFEAALGENMSYHNISPTVISLVKDGILKVLLWVIAVMLPPMAIFFPLFALLEDFGILPRIAFNADRPFEKCSACGKQALTICMGLGCNAVGVTGARIIESPKERAIAVITNSLTPCNGRFPLLIAITSIFISKSSVISSIILTCFILISFAATFLSSEILGKTILKGEKSHLIFELPKYRKPDFLRVLKDTVREKILKVLGRAICASTPCGVIIWALANIDVNGIPLLNLIAQKLDGAGQFIGLDGIILLAFILGFPANEIVLPIALAGYLSSSVIGDYSSLDGLAQILISNNWSLKTAICCCLFSMFHFPCATTLLTVIKETKSVKMSLLSVITPLLCGTISCALVNAFYEIFIC